MTKFHIGDRVRFLGSSDINDAGGVDSGTVRIVWESTNGTEYQVQFDNGTNENNMTDDDLAPYIG